MNSSLICRPLGGLNDVLCQIDYCHVLAQRFGSRLIIDTRFGRPGKHYTLGVQLDQLFKIPEEYAQIGLSEEDFNKSRIYPEALSGHLHALDTGPLSSLGLKLQEFDLRANPPKQPHDVYLHEASGGGLRSFRVIRMLGLNQRMKNLVFEALEEYSHCSVGIHVRNTDLKTDYSESLERIKESYGQEEEFLIASDDNEVRSEVRKTFGNAARFAGDWHPRRGGEVSNAERALLELCLLATRGELHILELAKGNLDGFPRFSGFSRLAKAMWLALRVRTLGPRVFFGSRSRLTGIAGDHSKTRNALFWIYFSWSHLLPTFSGATGVLADLISTQSPKSRGGR